MLRSHAPSSLALTCVDVCICVRVCARKYTRISLSSSTPCLHRHSPALACVCVCVCVYARINIPVYPTLLTLSPCLPQPPHPTLSFPPTTYTHRHAQRERERERETHQFVGNLCGTSTSFCTGHSSLVFNEFVVIHVSLLVVSSSVYCYSCTIILYYC